MVTDEKNFDKIKRIIKNQNNIRNIATSAHIHHGKCVSGDARLILADGKIKTAKEIFESVSKTGKLFQENKEHIIFSPTKPIEVFSLNTLNKKIEKKQIKHVWKLSGGKTIKLKLRNGFEIETTPEHKYFIFKEDKFEKIEAENLKLGDRVVCLRKAEVRSEIDLKKEFIRKLANENFYINFKKDFAETLKKDILKFGIKRLINESKVHAREKSFYHGIWQNRYNLSDFLKFLSFFDISEDKLYNNIEFIFYRTGKQRGQNSLKIKLPENFEEFFYLAGLFLGDGSGKKFVVGKNELGERLINICRKLGVKTKKVQRKDRTPEIHTNMTFIKILNCLFDYPLKQKAHNIKISEFVMSSPDNLVSELLKGYFDTDGCVEKSRRAVTISSASEQMIEDLHLVLLRFGIIAIKEKDNTLSISGLSALNFMKEIHFGLKEKAEKLKILTEKVSGSYVCDSVKIKDKIKFVDKKLKDNGLAFVEIKSIDEGFQKVVYDFTVFDNHNFVAEGVFISNTAFTDNLLAAAGKMAAKSAGDLDTGMATWQHADEQERLMTVDAANVSMVHEYDGQEYLINLIDTPGHVDFSGNVTRAMRAIDGTVVLVCASEGIMPQTETVLRQALKERVKPVLFINKVDRLIKELKLTPEQMQDRFKKIIKDFNRLVAEIAEPEFKTKWQANVLDGGVSFGSARDNWALTIPFMKKKGITFSDIYKIYDESLSEEERKEWVWKNASLFEAMMDVVVKHLPNPIEAQSYRIGRIWRGEKDSEIGKQLLKCDPNGEPTFVITRIVIDPRYGKEISAGRLFSGTLKTGQEVYLNLAKNKQRIQQLLVYDGIKPEQVDEISSGNVFAIGGIASEVGETISVNPVEPFEAITHLFEPVVTKSISAKKTADLPKLIEVLKQVGKEDPSIKVEINEETGESLISGMGELHLEIIENRIKTEKGLDVASSAPIVVFRESVIKRSEPAEGRSPNKHNTFFLSVEPLEDEVVKAIADGVLPAGRIKKKDKTLNETLVGLGVSRDEAQQYRNIFKGNVFLDKTKGEVHIGEVIELVLDSFEDVMKMGPLAREPCLRLKVSLVDLKLHEDAIHRGPAQVYPAIRQSIREAFAMAVPAIFEPVQVHQIEAPNSFMGTVTSLVSSKRGNLIDVEQDATGVTIRAEIPVQEMIGWTSDLRSATEGRGVSSLVSQTFKKLPSELQQKIIKQIRERKGLAENQ